MKASKLIVNFDSKYLNALEIEKVLVHKKGGRFIFRKQFTCLESTIECLMDGTVDAI